MIYVKLLMVYVYMPGFPQVEGGRGEKEDYLLGATSVANDLGSGSGGVFVYEWMTYDGLTMGIEKG